MTRTLATPWDLQKLHEIFRNEIKSSNIWYFIPKRHDNFKNVLEILGISYEFQKRLIILKNNFRNLMISSQTSWEFQERCSGFRNVVRIFNTSKTFNNSNDDLQKCHEMYSKVTRISGTSKKYQDHRKNFKNV